MKAQHITQAVEGTVRLKAAMIRLQAVDYKRSQVVGYECLQLCANSASLTCYTDS
jgi:hypothetical protein